VLASFTTYSKKMTYFQPKVSTSMSKFIPLRSWIMITPFIYLAIEWFAATYLGVLVSIFAPDLSTDVGDWLSPRILAMTVWGLVAIALWKHHFFWKIPVVKDVLARTMFPLLRGEWEFTIESNWPIIERLKDSAKSRSKSFDVLGQQTKMPEPSIFTFRAKIHQTWFSTQVEFVGNDGSVLESSRTLSVELLAKSETEPQQVSWVYRQWNKQGSGRKPNLTDEANFLGAALMRVTDDGELRGNYWTNRSWNLGLNAAGTIVGRRIN
jgi:hypothetical protein